MTKSLGLIGCGAFGTFMLRHLAPFFRVRVFDRFRDLDGIRQTYNVEIAATLETACTADIVVLAVPVQQLDELTVAIAPHLRPGAIILDVASVKLKPAAILARNLPANVDIVCTHPLFGPQSGKNGIAGLNIAVCPLRGQSYACVVAFLRERLGLKVIETTAERHDRELAYVQGLTHLIAKILVQIDVSDIKQTTRTWELLMQSVEIVRYDSEELFQAIESENPYVGEAKTRFFDAARALEARLSNHAADNGEAG
ncbi:prephenate dehydrogenase [Arboricoccus pini]|uniref:Prephenate dehydrogenase n=1 Tax=Arboricoccus pini TaxID=1963835 RepID=A0A212Q615_9PROT|nr:prephenate dehydrogenase [Arboricoccus pini]SNB54733.1 prephenate dehydrogenase [Arboricoccus pini]